MTTETFTLKVDTSALRGTLSDAAVDVLSERWRQISGEGWTPEHDDQHDQGEMAQAGAVYALLAAVEVSSEESEINSPIVSATRWLWPLAPKWLKPGSARRMLVKAAALIIAEIERLDRTAERGMQEIADESQKMGMY